MNSRGVNGRGAKNLSKSTRPPIHQPCCGMEPWSRRTGEAGACTGAASAVAMGIRLADAATAQLAIPTLTLVAMLVISFPDPFTRTIARFGHYYAADEISSKTSKTCETFVGRDGSGPFRCR